MIDRKPRDEPLQGFVDAAFRAVAEAEELIYAAGMRRDIKDDVIEAHSALLRLKTKLEAERRVVVPLKAVFPSAAEIMERDG